MIVTDILIAGTSSSDWLEQVQLKQSLSTLGACLTFQLKNDDLTPPPKPNVGDRVSLIDDGTTYFYGMVTETTDTYKNISVTAYDECYYLNKTKITIQFADQITTTEAIQELCKKIALRISYIPLMKNPVDAVYYASTPSDIMAELLSNEESANGGKYYKTSENFASITIRRWGSLSSGVALSAIIDATRTVSLDGIKNRVTLLVKDGDDYIVSETASNALSIAKFGILQEYVITSEDADNAVAYVQNKLNALSALLDEGEITVLGDWRLSQPGKRITVVEPITRLSGEYVIESAIQKKSEGHHETTLSLKKYHDYTPFKTVVSELLTPELKAVDESRKNIIPDEKTVSYTDSKEAALKIVGYFKSRDN